MSSLRSLRRWSRSPELMAPTEDTLPGLISGFVFFLCEGSRGRFRIHSLRRFGLGHSVTTFREQAVSKEESERRYKGPSLLQN